MGGLLKEVETNIFFEFKYFRINLCYNLICSSDTQVAYSGTPSGDLFKTTSETSYKCDSAEMVQLNKTIWNVTYSEVKIQPFGVVNDTYSKGNSGYILK